MSAETTPKTYHVPASRAFPYAEARLDEDNYVSLEFTATRHKQHNCRFHLYAIPDLVAALCRMWQDSTAVQLEGVHNANTQLGMVNEELAFTKAQMQEFQEHTKDHIAKLQAEAERARSWARSSEAARDNLQKELEAAEGAVSIQGVLLRGHIVKGVALLNEALGIIDADSAGDEARKQAFMVKAKAHKREVGA